MTQLADEIARRRTFAIISHPDAGKTTVTEQLLLNCGAIQLAGTVKARKSARHATSDWMKLEMERGISVTSSVMQFEHRDKVINLLDTPGHEDFSEDTYRTLTAVDSALMVIDAAKGVEERTRKLMEICRLRTTPIITFINKLDREGKNPVELLDEIEKELNITCAPVNWPIGMGGRFAGIFNLKGRYFLPFNKKNRADAAGRIDDVSAKDMQQFCIDDISSIIEEIELISEVFPAFDKDAYLEGKQTPVLFGSALHNFGIDEFLNCLTGFAPVPGERECLERNIKPFENNFTGFVFKIQANMDPAHRDRIAFLRICSGQYKKGMRLHHVRLKRDVQNTNALTFMAGNRERAEVGWPGDIIGLQNHGTIQVGDTFTQGEKLSFTGIPHFAPELFRRIRLQNPLKAKALLKGLLQLGEEGATQVFRPLQSNELIVGAIGVLQFDVVASRLKEEYGVDCNYENIPVSTARWIDADDERTLDLFKNKNIQNLALDSADRLTYLAPSLVKLNLTIERWPDIIFKSTCENISHYQN